MHIEFKICSQYIQEKRYQQQFDKVIWSRQNKALKFYKYYKKQQQMEDAEQTKTAHKGKKESKREKKRGTIRHIYKQNKKKNCTSVLEIKQNDLKVTPQKIFQTFQKIIKYFLKNTNVKNTI